MEEHYKPKIKNFTSMNFSETWWSGNEKYFCFMFIASRVMFQRYFKFNEHEIILLHVISARIVVP